MNRILTISRRAAALAVATSIALLATPVIASAALKQTDCNADGDLFRTNTYYLADGGYWYIGQAHLTLEGNTSERNNALYHVRGEANDRTYWSWRSGDNFPGQHTVPLIVDSHFPRSVRIYVQGWVNADQAVDSQCWTPRGYLL